MGTTGLEQRLSKSMLTSLNTTGMPPPKWGKGTLEPQKLIKRKLRKNRVGGSTEKQYQGCEERCPIYKYETVHSRGMGEMREEKNRKKAH